MTERKPYTTPAARVTEASQVVTPSDASRALLSALHGGMNAAQNVLETVPAHLRMGETSTFSNPLEAAGGVAAQAGAGMVAVTTGVLGLPAVVANLIRSGKLNAEDFVAFERMQSSPGSLEAIQAANYLSAREAGGVPVREILVKYEATQEFLGVLGDVNQNARNLADTVDSSRLELSENLSRDVGLRNDMQEFLNAGRTEGWFSGEALGKLGYTTIMSGLPAVGEALLTNPVGALQEAAYSLAPIVAAGRAAGVPGVIAANVAMEPTSAVSERLGSNVGAGFNADKLLASDTEDTPLEVAGLALLHAGTESAADLLTPGMGKLLGSSTSTGALLNTLTAGTRGVGAKALAGASLAARTVGGVVGNMDQEVVQTLLEGAIKATPTSPEELAQALVLGGVGSAPIIAASLPQKVSELSDAAVQEATVRELVNRGVTLDELEKANAIGTAGGDRVVALLANKLMSEINAIDKAIETPETSSKKGPYKGMDADALASLRETKQAELDVFAERLGGMKAAFESEQGVSPELEKFLLDTGASSVKKGIARAQAALRDLEENKQMLEEFNPEDYEDVAEAEQIKKGLSTLVDIGLQLELDHPDLADELQQLEAEQEADAKKLPGIGKTLDSITGFKTAREEQAAVEQVEAMVAAANETDAEIDVPTLNSNLRKMSGDSIAKLLEDEESAAVILGVIDRLDPTVQAKFDQRNNLGTRAKDRGTSIEETARNITLGNEGAIGTLQYYDTLAEAAYSKDTGGNFQPHRKLFNKWMATSRAKFAAFNRAFEETVNRPNETAIVTKDEKDKFSIQWISLPAEYKTWSEYRQANPLDGGKQWYVHKGSARLLNAMRQEMSTRNALSGMWDKVGRLAEGGVSPEEEAAIKKQLKDLASAFPEYDGLAATVGETVGAKPVSGKKLVARRNAILESSKKNILAYLGKKTPTEAVAGLRVALRVLVDTAGVGEALGSIPKTELRWAERYLGTDGGKLRLIGAMITAQMLLGLETVDAGNVAQVLAKTRQIIGTRPMLQLERRMNEILQGAAPAEQPKAATPKKASKRASKADDAPVDTTPVGDTVTSEETAADATAEEVQEAAPGLLEEPVREEQSTDVVEAEATVPAVIDDAVIEREVAKATPDKIPGIRTNFVKSLPKKGVAAIRRAIQGIEWFQFGVADAGNGRTNLMARITLGKDSVEGSYGIESLAVLQAALAKEPGKYRPVILMEFPKDSDTAEEVTTLADALAALINDHDALVITEPTTVGTELGQQFRDTLAKSVIGKPALTSVSRHLASKVGGEAARQLREIIATTIGDKDLLDTISGAMAHVWQREEVVEETSEEIPAPIEDTADKNLGVALVERTYLTKNGEPRVIRRKKRLKEMFSFPSKHGNKWSLTPQSATQFFRNWTKAVGLLSRYAEAYPGSTAFSDEENLAGISGLSQDLSALESALQSAYALFDKAISLPAPQEDGSYLFTDALMALGNGNGAAFYEIFDQDGKLVPAVRQAMAMAFVQFVDRTKGRAIYRNDADNAKMIRGIVGQPGAQVEEGVLDWFRRGNFLQANLEVSLGSSVMEALGWVTTDEAYSSTEKTFKAFLGAMMVDQLKAGNVVEVFSLKASTTVDDSGNSRVTSEAVDGASVTAFDFVKVDLNDFEDFSGKDLQKEISDSIQTGNGASRLHALNVFLQVSQQISAAIHIVQGTEGAATAPTDAPRKMPEEKSLTVFAGLKQKVAPKIMQAVRAMSAAPRFANMDIIGPLEAMYASLGLGANRNDVSPAAMVFRALLGGSTIPYDKYPPILQKGQQAADRERVKDYLEFTHWLRGRKDPASPFYLSHTPWENERSAPDTRIGNPTSKVNRVLVRPGSKQANIASKQVQEAAAEVRKLEPGFRDAAKDVREKVAVLRAAKEELEKAQQLERAQKETLASITERDSVEWDDANAAKVATTKRVIELKKQVIEAGKALRAAKAAKDDAKKALDNAREGLQKAQEALAAASGMPTYDLGDTAAVNTLLAGMANGVDAGIDKKAQEIAVNKMLENFQMTRDFTFREGADSVYKQAIEALQAYYKSPEAGISAENAEIISKATGKIGNGLQGFQVLANMAKVMNAKEAGQSSVQLYQVSEVDGVANGPSLAQMLYATVGSFTQFNNYLTGLLKAWDDPKNSLAVAKEVSSLKEMVKAYTEKTSWMQRAGFFPVTDDSTPLFRGDYNVYRGQDGVKDTYEFLGELTFRFIALYTKIQVARKTNGRDTRWDPSNTEVLLQLLEMWGQDVAKARALYKKIGESRDGGKQAYPAKLAQDYVNALSDALKSTAAIKAARTLLKNPITQIHYAAAESTLLRSVTNNILDQILEKAAEANAMPDGEEKTFALAKLNDLYNKLVNGNKPPTQVTEVRSITPQQFYAAQRVLDGLIGNNVNHALSAALPGISTTSRAMSGALNGASMWAFRLHEQIQKALRSQKSADGELPALSKKEMAELWEGVGEFVPKVVSASASDISEGFLMFGPEREQISQTNYTKLDKVDREAGYTVPRNIATTGKEMVYGGMPKMQGIGVAPVPAGPINRDARISHEAIVDENGVAEPFYNNHDSHYGEAQDIVAQTKKLNLATWNMLAETDALQGAFDAAYRSLKGILDGADKLADRGVDVNAMIRELLKEALALPSATKSKAQAAFLVLGLEEDIGAEDVFKALQGVVNPNTLRALRQALEGSVLAESNEGLTDTDKAALSAALRAFERGYQTPAKVKQTFMAGNEYAGLVAIAHTLSSLLAAEEAAVTYRFEALAEMAYISQYAYEGGAAEITQEMRDGIAAKHEAAKARIGAQKAALKELLVKMAQLAYTNFPVEVSVQSKRQASKETVPDTVEVVQEESAPVTEDEGPMEETGVPTTAPTEPTSDEAMRKSFGELLETAFTQIISGKNSLSQHGLSLIKKELQESILANPEYKIFLGEVFDKATRTPTAVFAAWAVRNGVDTQEVVDTMSNGPGALGVYVPGSKAIIVNNADDVQTATVVLHEALHAWSNDALMWAQGAGSNNAAVKQAMPILQKAAAAVKDDRSLVDSIKKQIYPDGNTVDLHEFVSWALGWGKMASLLSNAGSSIKKVREAIRDLFNAFLQKDGRKFPASERSALTDTAMAMLAIRRAYYDAGAPQELGFAEMRQMAAPSNMDTFATVLTQGLIAENHSPVYVERIRNVVLGVTARVYRKAFKNPAVVAKLQKQLQVTSPGQTGFRQDSAAAMVEQSAVLPVSQGELIALNQLEMSVRHLLNDKASGYQFRRQLEKLHADALKRYPTPQAMLALLTSPTQADVARVSALHAMLFESAQNDRGGALLARFAAMAVAYADAADFFQYTPATKGDSKTFLQKIVEVISRMLTWFEAKDRVLDQDGSAVDQITEVLTEMAANQMTYRRWVKKGDGRIAQWLNRHANVSGRVGMLVAKSKWVRKSKYSPVRLAGILYGYFQNGQMQDYLDVLRNARDQRFPNEEHGLLAKTITELRGVLPEAKNIYTLFNRVRRLENNRQDTLRDVSMAALSAFKDGEKLDSTQRKGVLALALRTGFWRVGEVLTGELLAERLERYMADDKELATDIKQMHKMLASMTNPDTARVIVAVVERFGHFWATGEVRGSLPSLNLEHMLKQALPKGQTPSSQMLEATQALAALYAVGSAKQAMTGKEQAAVQKLLKTENLRTTGNGFEYVIAQHKIFEERTKALYRNSHGDFATVSYQDNWLPDLVDPRMEIAWELESNVAGKKKTGDGYEVLPIQLDAGISKGSRFSMVPLRNKLGTPQRYTSGILLRGRTHLRGTDYKVGLGMTETQMWRRFMAEVSHGTPLANLPRNSLGGVVGLGYAGMPTAYTRRGMLSFAEQAKYQNAQEDFSETLAAYSTKLFEKEEIDTVTPDLMDGLNAFAKKEFKHMGIDLDTLLDQDAKGQFVHAKALKKVLASWVLVSDQKGLPGTDKYAKDFNQIPQQAWEGNYPYVWIRKDMVDLVLGHDQMSLSRLVFRPQEFANDPDGPRLLKFIGDKIVDFLMIHRNISEKDARNFAYNWMKHKGMITREMVAMIKDVIVVRSVVVYIGNTLSNWYHLKNLGVPWKTIIRGYVLGHQAATQYRRDFAELEQLGYQLEVGVSEEPLDVVRRKHAVIQARLDSNPVREYIELGLLPSIVEDVSVTESSMFSPRVEWQEAVEKRIPKVIRPVVGNLFVLPGSSLYHAMNTLTQLSDFAARVSYLEHLREQGDKRSMEEQALVAMEEFVWYDLPQDSRVEWANQVGLLMFTKYFVRIQKVLFNLIRQHPLRTLGFGLLDSMVLDIPNPMESFVTEKDFGLDYLGFGPLEIGTVFTEPAPIDAMF